MRDNLIKLLNVLGMNQREFSERIGVATSTVSNLMIGKSNTLSATALRRIREEFQVNLNWLVCNTAKEPIFIRSVRPGFELKLKEMTRADLLNTCKALQNEVIELQEGKAREDTVDELIKSTNDLPVAKVRIVKRILKLLKEKDTLMEKLRN